MKHKDTLFKEKACGIYMCIAALISFFTLSPWYEIVKYSNGEDSISCTPIEYLDMANANKAYQIVLWVFYAILAINFISGSLLILLSNCKKKALIAPLIIFFLYIVLALLSLGYFLEVNGLNVPSVILSVVGMGVVGVYFVNSLTDFITSKMEKRAIKEIK